MEKKIIFLELPTDIIEKIDDHNKIGTRSIFILDLLEKQLTQVSRLDAATEIPTSMHAGERDEVTGEISLVNSQGVLLGKFNINTGEGFGNLAEKICEISNDPIVRMKVRHWR
jgi:hypothetical protein